jgi:hypothetical protein
MVGYVDDELYPLWIVWDRSKFPLNQDACAITPMKMVTAPASHNTSTRGSLTDPGVGYRMREDMRA